MALWKAKNPPPEFGRKGISLLFQLIPVAVGQLGSAVGQPCSRLPSKPVGQIAVLSLASSPGLLVRPAGMKLSPPGLLNPSLPHPSLIPCLPLLPHHLLRGSPSPLCAQALLGAPPWLYSAEGPTLPLPSWTLHPVAFTRIPLRCPLHAEHQCAVLEHRQDPRGGCCYLGEMHGPMVPWSPSGMLHPPSHGAARASSSTRSSSVLPSPKCLPKPFHRGPWLASWQGHPGSACAGSRECRPALCWDKQKWSGRGTSAANSSFLFPALCCLPAIFACKQ